MKRSPTVLFLSLIVLISFVLRFYQLAQIPDFHADEADFANNAYSLLKIGVNQDGKAFSWGTTTTGDYRPSLYIYLAVITTKIFGFNEIGTRLPTVFFSVLTVILIYFLGEEIFRNKKISLTASLFTALSFWHITLSREASEKIVALFFVTLGILFLFKYLRLAKIKYLITGLVIFFLSIHTYYAPRMFLLLFLPFFTFFALRTKALKQKQVPLFLLVSLFLLSVIFFTFFYSQSSERIKQLTIFNHPQTQALLGEQISEDGVGDQIFLTRMYHNKIVGFALTLADNYQEYLSPRFLFLKGGFPQRVRIPQVGLLNIFEAPLLLVGLFLLISRLASKKEVSLLLLFCWGVLTFVPAALTFDEIPNVYRTVLALPVFVLISAYGFVSLFGWLAKSKAGKLVLIVFFVGYGWFFSYFMHQYFVHSPIHQPWLRNYAQMKLAQAIAKDYASAKLVFVPELFGGVEQIFRFYLKYDPAQYQADRLTMDKSHQHLGNVQFTPEICPYRKLMIDEEDGLNNSPDYVFVNSPECHSRWVTKNDTVDQIIYWRDGLPAYEIIRGKAKKR